MPTPFVPIVFQGDAHRRDVVVGVSNRARVFSVDGTIISDFLPEEVKGSTRVCVLPYDDVVVLAQWDEKIVTAYDWHRSTRLWRIEDLGDLFYMSCVNSRELLVLQCSGRCFHVDASTGRIGEQLDRVAGVWTDSAKAGVLLMRKPAKTGARYRLEFRETVGGVPRFAYEVAHAQSMAAFGDGWMALADHLTGTLTCIDESGRKLWSFTPDGTRQSTMPQQGVQSESLYQFLVIESSPERSHVLGIVHAKERGPPAECLIWKASDGSIVTRHPMPAEQLPFFAAAERSLLVATTGVWRLPELIWEPRDFSR